MTLPLEPAALGMDRLEGRRGVEHVQDVVLNVQLRPCGLVLFPALFDLLFDVHANLLLYAENGNLSG